MAETWKVIVNPKAGSGKATEEWPRIKNELEKHGLIVSETFTEHKYHAIELATEAAKNGFRKFIAIGGDGTLHEVVNGIFLQNEVPSTEFTVATIPVGTGNDWGRLYNLPREADALAGIIADGATKLQDVARVETVMNGRTSTRFMINIGGMAFDASVCYHFDKMKMNGGSGTSLYVKGLLKGFLGYTSRHFKIKLDDKPYYTGKVFSTAFGIGKYSGGGMLQTPEAVADDGLLDVTVIKNISKFKVLCNISKLFKGNILSINSVIHAQASKVEITSFPPSRVEVDGENVGISPLKIEMIPLAINVIVPKN